MSMIYDFIDMLEKRVDAVDRRPRVEFLSVLHPPSLACDSSASCGEMSRRSGVAAKEDNHTFESDVERADDWAPKKIVWDPYVV